MKAKSKTAVGREFESKVRSILESHEHKVIEQNYYCKIGEIDLIAIDNSQGASKKLVFVEARFRKNDHLVNPLESLNSQKRKRLRGIASFFRMTKPMYQQLDCRFDLFIGLDSDVRWIQGIEI